MVEVLIVEDEPIENEALKKELAHSFDSINIHTALTAQAAIELITKTRLDLIILDIKLQNRSGFEVGRHAKQVDPNIKIIIITAYTEFDFAYNALKLRIEDFFLKPVRPSVLIQTVKEIVESKEQEPYSEVTLWPYMEKRLTGQLRKVLTACPNYIGVCGLKYRNKQGFIEAAKKFLLENLKEIGWAETNEELFVIYFNTRDLKQIDKIVMDLNKNFYLKHNQRFTVGMSSIFLKIEDMSEGYGQAMDSYHSSMFFPDAEIIFFEELQKNKNNICRYPYIIESEILNSLACLDFAKGRKNVKDILQYFLENCGRDFILLKEWYNNFSYSIKRFCDQKGIKPEACLSMDYWHTPGEFEQDVLGSMDRVAEALLSNKRNVAPVINEVFNYINLNYQTEITLEIISKKLSINPVYLSRLFKQQTGETFKGYLTKFRLEKAKLLLLDYSRTISDIAYSVGYQDANYFSEAFKKYQGIPPTEYRSKSITPF